jgi:hypothetical protein
MYKMINKLLGFKFTNNIFYTILIGFVHIGTDQNLYVNLNFILACYIPLLVILPHKFNAFKILKLAKKKSYKTKIVSTYLPIQYQLASLFSTILPTCPVLMLLTCSPNIYPNVSLIIK